MAKKDNEFTSVTTFSKVLAFIMFVTFPFVGFYIGMHYQKELDRPFIQETIEEKRDAERTEPAVKLPSEGFMCTMEAKICPDGTYVGRVGPNCDFQACPE